MQVKKENTEKGRQEDFEAVKKVLNGDSNAFFLLERKYKGIITALIRRMIRDEEDVKDLAQESFIKAYKALNTFQFGYSFSAWLYRIASNTCIDFLRKKRFSTVSLNQSPSNSEDEYELEIEDSAYSPDLGLLDKERRKALGIAVESLPENYREIIKLRHEEEMDYKDIADKLNIPLGTVKAHLFRARKILFASLNKQKHLFTDS